MHKTYDEKYITKVIKSSYICANSNINFTLVNYLVSKILGKIQGTEMLVDRENLGTR